MDILHSNIDQSVNFIDWQSDGGAFESRYVRRSEDYFIAYLSSLTGCNRACRMCHLTQTGQTTMGNATVNDLVDQAVAVLKHYRSQPSAAKIHFNFMARGEPLSNPFIQKQWGTVSGALLDLASAAGIPKVKLNLSTIMPVDADDLDLAEAFDQDNTSIYYSLYSMRPEFRRRWLPRAMDPNRALDKLVDWQQATGRQVVLHWAFIEGENDDEGTIEEIIEAVNSRCLVAKFNAVRYNPYSEQQGREPSEEIVKRNFEMLSSALTGDNSRIVSRVGTDVAASCGCFVDKLGD